MSLPRQLLLALVTAGALGACGLKGDLYLPDERDQAPPPPAVELPDGQDGDAANPGQAGETDE